LHAASRGLAFAPGFVIEATTTFLSTVSGGDSNTLPAASDGSNWLIRKKENSMSNITLVLNDPEQQAFHQLLDIALRQAGLNALDVVYHFRGRILSAQGTPSQAEAASQKPADIAAAHPPLAPAQTVAQAPSHPVQPAQAAHVQPTQTQTVQAHPAQAAQTHAQPAQAAQHSSGATTPQHQSILGEIIDGLTGKQHTATAPAATSAVPAAAAPVATSVAPATTSAAAAAATAAAPAPAVAQTVAALAPQNTVSAPHS